MCVYSAAYTTSVQRAGRPFVVSKFEIGNETCFVNDLKKKIRVSCVLLIFETLITVSGYQRCREKLCFHLQDIIKANAVRVFPPVAIAALQHSTKRLTTRHISIHLIYSVSDLLKRRILFLCHLIMKSTFTILRQSVECKQFCFIFLEKYDVTWTKMRVFWDETLCSLTKISRDFQEVWYFQGQVRFFLYVPETEDERTTTVQNDRDY